MAEGAAAAAQAKDRRKEQLRQWARSCTNQEPAEPRWQRRRRRRRRVGDGEEEEDEGDRASQGEGDGRAVRFERAAEFLASCAAGDLLEAEEMLTGDSGKEVIDSTNTDGISALHQACIDENLEVVEFLVNHRANVNQADNEGWTPLHVAASCGYMEIAEYLLKHSANIAAVNSDGDVPLDIAEDDCMETLLRAEIAKGGVDIDAAKREEEEVMLRDARQWLNAGKIEDIRHSKTGASALHVAAAKGYIEVMRLLLQANYDPNVRDKDGWTPLHAAAHWGVEEGCRLLVEHFCDMNALNTVGQRPCDVADEDVASLLEELQKKQEDLRNEKEANLKHAVIDTNMEQHPSYSNKHRRSSVCRMSSKEKISVQDQSKERKTLGTISVGEEENVSSSEEETENALEPGNNPQVNENGLLPDAHNSTVHSASSEQKHDAWEILHKWNRRLKESEARCIVQAENSAGCMLASCRKGKPSGHLNKEPLLARVQPTPSRRIFSPSESLQDSKKESYQTPVRDEESESQRKARSRLMRQSRRSTQGVTLTDLKEAEKTLGKPGDSPSTEPKTKAEDSGEKGQSMEGSDITRRLGLPSTEHNISASTINTVNSPSKKELESTSKEELEAESQNHLTARDRRKWRKDQRLGLGTNSYAGMENDEAESVHHNETSGYGVTESWSSLLPHRTGSHTFQRRNFGSKEESEKDYKKLYENLLADNETLRDQLQETELKLTQIRLELERVTQRQERSAERPALLELERFERRALERKVAELEEELKVLSDLKADNQRLKDENAALIRVISKLSK
ncbi:protein phosphatase 1 regulatory subunit 12C isoform X2 [Xenopus laevis]|uniref:Protein phosphatase 1 regulatory subunit n=1 Tax=Xenopus laevis TaxID=8355 RepID=A0A8J0T344_XENLA|nr:protein phosphatase 1 regulatory subunit 12C isoform X2 [Xenopus laevis]